MAATVADAALPVDRTIDELDAAICRLARRMNAETYRLLLLVREFDDRLGWSKWSFRCCAEWLAWRCGLSLSAAREKVRTAQALRRLPAIAAAFADGRLSYSKVRALTRAADACDEELLLAYALEATAAQVEERCRQLRNVEPGSVEIARRAWQRRSMSIWRKREAGTMRITVEVPIEEGEVIARAVDRAVEAHEAASEPEFGAVGWQAQQADALIAVAKSYLSGVVGAVGAVGATEANAEGNAQANAEKPGAAGDAAATSDAKAKPDEARHSEGAVAPASGGRPSGDHSLVVIHVDAAALSGGAGRSDLPIETVKRLTCDGSLITVVDDEQGVPLHVGRKQRTASASLRRAVWSRDRGCSFPGCERTHYVDMHHIRHWADGGGTSLENLTLLCSHHHRLLHEGGFKIRRDADGAIYFERADGRVIPRRGYRLDDVLDDGFEDAPDHVRADGLSIRALDGVLVPDASPEARLRAIIAARKLSAEVREAAGSYCFVPNRVIRGEGEEERRQAWRRGLAAPAEAPSSAGTLRRRLSAGASPARTHGLS